MKRIIFIFGIISLIALIPMTSHNTVEAQCRVKASCYAADDTGEQPWCLDGPYDPCDSWITYTWEFDRTAQTGSPNAVRFTVMAGVAYKWYSQHWSGNYEEGHYSGSGSAYVGASLSHTTQIRRASTGSNSGNFEEMRVGITYVADNPD